MHSEAEEYLKNIDDIIGIGHLRLTNLNNIEAIIKRLKNKGCVNQQVQTVEDFGPVEWPPSSDFDLADS
jgi:hypothetical protein